MAAKRQLAPKRPIASSFTRQKGPWIGTLCHRRRSLNLPRRGTAGHRAVALANAVPRYQSHQLGKPVIARMSVECVRGLRGGGQCAPSESDEEVWRHHRPAGAQPRGGGRRIPGSGGAFRLRQVDGAQDDRRPRGNHRGAGPHRRRNRQRAGAARPRHRHGLPELCALPAHDGLRQHRLLAADRQAAEGGDQEAGSPRSRGSCSSRTI